MSKTYLIVTTQDMPNVSSKLVSKDKHPVFVKEFNDLEEAKQYDGKVLDDKQVELTYLVDDVLLAKLPENLYSYEKVDNYKNIFNYEMALFKQAARKKDGEKGEVNLHDHSLELNDVVFASNHKIDKDTDADSFGNVLNNKSSEPIDDVFVRNAIANYKYQGKTMNEAVDALSRAFQSRQVNDNETDSKAD